MSPDGRERTVGVRRALTEATSLELPFHSSLLQSRRSDVARSDVRRQYQATYWRMAVSDTLSVFAALLLAYMIRFGDATPTPDFWLLLLTTPLVTPAVYLALRLYRVHQFSTAEEFRRIIVAISLIISAVVMVSFWSKASFSRGWMAVSWVLALLLASASRRLWHWRFRRARLAGRLTFRTLIVGANAEAERLAATMQVRELGFEPVGFVSGGMDEVRLDDPGVVGPIGNLRQLIRDTRADCLFVASSAVTPEDVVQIMKARRLTDVEIRFTANLPSILSTRLAPQTLGGVMTLSVNVLQLTRFQAAAKRACDLLVSGLGLLLLAPLLGVIAVAVRLSSPGPAIFRQERVGLRGRSFTLLKFRTMVLDADLLLDGLRERNEADGPLFKLREDPRVTRIGRILRRYSLDELPQLVNVLRGEMSLVGPRPPLPHEVAVYEEWQLDRLEVRPGITGLWQVSGRSELSFDDYVRLDLFYIENWSIAYDLFILSKTVPLLVAARGAY
ncbi:MAG TPA: sugar transferase [Actinomycetes bacterium]|jgi:exopolysaccharide biosynthesis polyprenyl glycosylphosphotransferase|nr:sugar transferase [Actinomycetes bacterium]